MLDSVGAAPKRAKTEDGTVEPGDDFNARANWHEILVPHGWGLDHDSEGTGFWRRAGKVGGHSATTNHNGNDTLYVFTNATVFKQHGSYSKFGAYTVLNHGGDFKAAARELSQEGYGTHAVWVEKDGEQVREIRKNPYTKGVPLAKPVGG